MDLDEYEIEKKLIIWDAVSKAWTEIGSDDSDRMHYAIKIKRHYSDWSEVVKVIGGIQKSFAIMSLLILIFFPIMPDWGYDKEYLRQKIIEQNQRQLFGFGLNPLRWILYPLSLLFSSSEVRKLKAEFLKIHN